MLELQKMGLLIKHHLLRSMDGWMDGWSQSWTLSQSVLSHSTNMSISTQKQLSQLGNAPYSLSVCCPSLNTL
jgi:hypothetical protein